MSVYLGRLRRYGAWALIAAGLWVALEYALAWNRGRVRAAWLEADRYVCEVHRFHGKLYQVPWIAKKHGRERAERELDQVRWRGDLTEAERDLAFATGARLRVEYGDAPETELLPYLDPTRDVCIWGDALWHLVETRERAGNVRGSIDLLERVVDGRLRHSALDRCPFPYLEQEASRRLAIAHIGIGDGPRAHAWARRYKYEFDAAFNAPCGAPFAQQGNEMEDLLERSAKLAGWAYVREDRERIWSNRSRRIYGPPGHECIVASIVGMELFFLGVGLLAPPVPRSRPAGPVYWRPRGLVARFHLGYYLAGFGFGMLSLLPELLRSGGTLSGESTVLLSFLSLLFCAVLVPFLGCFIATPERPPAPARNRRHFPSAAA